MIVGGVVDVEVLLALRRIVRARLQDADDLRLLRRQIERLADDGGSDPNTRCQYACVSTATGGADLRFVGGHEHPSEQRLRAEHREEVRRDQPAGRAMRLAAPEHVERPVAEFDELVDRLRRAIDSRPLPETRTTNPRCRRPPAAAAGA